MGPLSPVREYTLHAGQSFYLNLQFKLWPRGLPYILMDVNIVSPSNNYKALSLRVNFSWNLAGNLVYAACQWGIVVVLAKLTSPEMVGRFALGLAVTAPIIMLSNLQLRSVQATDARGEYQFGHYLGLRLVTTMLALMTIAAVAFWSKYPLQVGLVILVVGFSSNKSLFFLIVQVLLIGTLLCFHIVFQCLDLF